MGEQYFKLFALEPEQENACTLYAHGLNAAATSEAQVIPDTVASCCTWGGYPTYDSRVACSVLKSYLCRYTTS
jgi:hypothetical protein